MNRLKILPNLLTVSRISATPIAVYFLLHKNFQTSFFLFVALALTDSLDGYFARKLNAHTKLGSFLDPLADKFTVILFFTALMIMGNCPAWFLGLIISVTVLQALGLSWIEALSTRRKMEFAPLGIGKLNMLLQLVWIGWLLLRITLNKGATIGYISWPESLVFTSLAVIQVGVFILYFFHYRVHLTPEVKTLFPVHTTESAL